MFVTRVCLSSNIFVIMIRDIVSFSPLSESGHPRPPIHIDAVVMVMNPSALLVETFSQSKDWEGKGNPKMDQAGIDL